MLYPLHETFPVAFKLEHLTKVPNHLSLQIQVRFWESFLS